ncbi:hypothetical protein NO042_50073 [Flavobacterium psychrophilum]|nr:hypothetical protein FI070_430145 [Flavobacterium psychrophilum]SNA88457.1 hypothetical protein FI146_90032 [Flavobacterium psychrophilum]SNB05883.1 hypothetical protein KU06062604_1130005 [Flavobacterium psychrophilum]SNB11473.1 hypothetical protein KU05112810_40009 [Flavobacterium psychrophilum]SNB35192.1 hypothetical protein NO042_50073 [Flavobacterium psychrophilum]
MLLNYYIFIYLTIKQINQPKKIDNYEKNYYSIFHDNLSSFEFCSNNRRI